MKDEARIPRSSFRPWHSHSKRFDLIRLDAGSDEPTGRSRALLARAAMRPQQKIPLPPPKKEGRAIPREAIFSRGHILRCAAIPKMGCNPVAAGSGIAPSKSGQIKLKERQMPLSPETNPGNAGLTSAIFDELALHGATPAPGEVDHRPLPQPDQVELAMTTLFETTIGLLTDSQLEDNLEEMLWSLTSIFHRRLSFLQKRLDDNEGEVRAMIGIQDGSEITSVELERLQMIGLKLWDHRDAFEQMRDLASEHFSAATGSPWLPRTGSKVSHRGLTSAVIDSRAYLSAKRRKETEIHCPEGTRIAFSGGDYQAYDLIWAVLDATHEKYPDMILLHGGTPRGAEMIASRWADTRGVTQVVFKPDWKNHGKAAPFKRNDKILDTMPQGLIATPGSGITENIVDKARKLGIRVKRIGA